MRVAVVFEADHVYVGGQGRVAVGEGVADLAPGEEIRLEVDGDHVRVVGRDGVFFRRLQFQSRESDRMLLVNGKAYRGRVDVFAREGSLFAVNELGLEEYLMGVVGIEMGHRERNERAALEAQAIVSRSYALSNRGKFQAQGYDIRAGESDQAYLGVDRETALGREAVRATVGRVLTYDRDIIDAFFHSTCGHSTASPDEAFHRVPVQPYLRPVSDRRPNGGYYGDMAPWFSWTIEWEGARLLDILRASIPQTLGVDSSIVDHVRDIGIEDRGPSSRVTELSVELGTGQLRVLGPDIRNVLLTPDGVALPSTAFELSVTYESERVKTLRVEGLGRGHGVGMCQWGAIGRARSGQSTETIVSTYYPGTSVERRY